MAKSDVSVDIMPDGIFLNLNTHPPGRNKYWVSYDKCPMFKDVYDFHICNVEFNQDVYVSYLYWPELKLHAVCCCGILQFVPVVLGWGQAKFTHSLDSQNYPEIYPYVE